MLGLPESTQLPKPLSITKKAVYDKFRNDFTPEKQRLFDADISRIRLLNEISPKSVNISPGKHIGKIFVIEVRLKNKAFDEKNIYFISKLIDQNLIFRLVYDSEDGSIEKLAAYYKVVHQTEWRPEGSVRIDLTALDMDSLWENLIIQIGNIGIDKGRTTLDKQIENNERIDAIQKQIAVLEKKIAKEKQFNRQIELNQELRKMKAELEILVSFVCP